MGGPRPHRTSRSADTQARTSSSHVPTPDGPPCSLTLDAPSLPAPAPVLPLQTILPGAATPRSFPNPNLMRSVLKFQSCHGLPRPEKVLALVLPFRPSPSRIRSLPRPRCGVADHSKDRFIFPGAASTLCPRVLPPPVDLLPLPPGPLAAEAQAKSRRLGGGVRSGPSRPRQEPPSPWPLRPAVPRARKHCRPGLFMLLAAGIGLSRTQAN